MDNKGKEIPGSKGAEGREYINLLFKLEDEIKELEYNEKRDKEEKIMNNGHCDNGHIQEQHC